MKKFLSMMAIAATALLSLASCGSDKDDDDVTTTTKGVVYTLVVDANAAKFIKSVQCTYTLPSTGTKTENISVTKVPANHPIAKSSNVELYFAEFAKSETKKGSFEVKFDVTLADEIKVDGEKASLIVADVQAAGSIAAPGAFDKLYNNVSIQGVDGVPAEKYEENLRRKIELHTRLYKGDL